MPDGQFYGAILWYHLMAPFYGTCVPGLIQYRTTVTDVQQNSLCQKRQTL